jgi:hypothetical protein
MESSTTTIASHSRVQFLAFMPLILGIVVVLAWLFSILFDKPPFSDYTRLLDQLNANQKLTIDLVTELNKYLISIGTALFSVAAFFLTTYKKGLHLLPISLAYLLSLVTLGGGYFFAFKVYTELISELSQKELGIRPGFSSIFYYLQSESILCAGASITLMSIFVYVFYARDAS